MESIAEAFKKFYYEDGNTNAAGMDAVLSLLRNSTSSSSWKTVNDLVESIDLSTSSSTSGAAYFTIAALLFHTHQYRGCMEVIEKIHSKLDQCSDALCYKICFLGIETLLQISLAPGLNGGENERAHFQTKFHVYIDLVNKKCANLEPGFLKFNLKFEVALQN